MNVNKKNILIDGNSLVYRMFYGIHEMSNSKGIPTNAVYGFVNVLVKIQSDYKPDYFAVAFDLKTPTFRHEVYDAYKGGRDKMPEDLEVQMVLLKELLEKMNVPMITLEGYEADDIIGTLAKKGEAENIKTQIITGDKDSFQLVDDYINILYTATRSGSQFVNVDHTYIMERYGVIPKELIDVKALMGDPSDNIPGVAGIGEKTALKLIKEYHNIDTLYENIDDLKGKQKEKLEIGKESAFSSRFLGTVCLDAPVGIELEDIKFESIFNEESIEMLKELEFRSVLSKMTADTNNEKSIIADVEFTTIDNLTEMITTMNRLARKPKLTLYAHQEDERVWVAAYIDGIYYYIKEPDMVHAFFRNLSEIPQADQLQTVGHDLKNLTHIYHRQGSVLVNYTFDSYIAAYLLSPADQRYDLQVIAAKYLDESILNKDDFFGTGKKQVKAETMDAKNMAHYMVKNCQIIHKLEEVLLAEIKKLGMMELFEKIELPLLKVMASMEELGFTVDLHQLETLSLEFEEKLVTLTCAIYQMAEESDFNINSTKQLGVILFDKLKLPVIKKTKTGYSTNAEVLDQLVLFHPIIQKIIDYRMISKLDSTYGKGLIKLVNPKTHKIYSTFNQTVAATGRLSSSDPNLQNIPVKTEMGREIRKVFVPSDDTHLLVDADYSQIELRVLAHLSGDENLIDTFLKEQDIHTRTASEIFNTPMEEVTREQRSHAKAINFGLIYGKQAFSLGKDLGITRNEAQTYIDLYFSRYPKVMEYMENIKEEAKMNGYVTTIWGRRRYIPEIQSRNRMLVQSGERMALNTPIQGAAADIIKMAMIKVYNRLEKEKLHSKLILQVHDELIIDTLKSEEEQVMRLIIEEMESAAELRVPLTVDAHAGHSWFDIK
ncbi:MAG: DNA polymerase I [Eubacterium sp.]